MKFIRLASAIVILSTCLVGCNSGTVATESVPAQEPKKGSQNDAIQNNPKIPDAAKKAIMGSQGQVPGGK
ncbi:MAG TPA: hypothetical protein VKT78_20595 [Fimbriimonadaceae bacterium]|nr:hypothetical protein [Fimbriimonadaceae bacterium]